MSIELNQAIWEVATRTGIITGIINNPEPLGMSEWIDRIERSVADALTEVGTYDLNVRIGPLLEKSWTVHVRRVAQVSPF